MGSPRHYGYLSHDSLIKSSISGNALPWRMYNAFNRFVLVGYLLKDKVKHINYCSIWVAVVKLKIKLTISVRQAAVPTHHAVTLGYDRPLDWQS